jgi:hypothetical protein
VKNALHLSGRYGICLNQWVTADENEITVFGLPGDQIYPQ